MATFGLKNVILAWFGLFWPKRGHMTKLWVSKVTFDLEIRFSVKNWPRKHICHDNFFRTQQNFFFWQKPGWDPVWDPKIPKPQNDFFKKCSNLTSEQCFWAKMSWKIDSEQRKNPKVPKNAFLGVFWFWAKFTGSTLRGPKWRFCEVRSSAVCCPFELKIDMGAL